MRLLQVPDPATAERLLLEAEARNPGRWVDHSRVAAEAARRIAERLPQLDAASAHSLGLLHDIGRREGISGMRHAYDGYRFLMDDGFPDAARICLTHSFPYQHIEAASSRWDCTAREMEEIRIALEGTTYDDYDRLLQLCDAIALPQGFCLMEKRLLDVLMRYENFNAFTIPKWRAYFEIKAHFEAQLGCSIYDLLPGVVETTFQA